MFVSVPDIERIKNRYAVIDTNFLIGLFQNEEILNESISFFTKNNILMVIDNLVGFEFLRSSFLPEEILKRERFIDNEVFSRLPQHQEIFKKLERNALLLSQIYAHQHKKSDRNNKISITDLFLSAQLMRNTKYILITSNKKDFPICIFDTVGMFCFEYSSGECITYYLMEFNKEKYNSCSSSLEDLSIRHN